MTNEYREFVTNFFDANFRSELKYFFTTFLNKSDLEISNDLSKIEVKVVYIPGFHPAFYSFINNKLYVNQAIEEEIDRKIENEDDRAFFRSFYLIHAFTHESVHSQAKTTVHENVKGNTEEYKVSAGFLRGRATTNVQSGQTKSEIKNFVLNEAITELISFMILFRISQGNNLKLKITPDKIRQYLEFGIEKERNIYLIFIYQIIQICKHIAKRHNLPLEVIRNAFINSYLNGADLNTKLLSKELGKAFKSNKIFNTFARSASGKEGLSSIGKNLRKTDSETALEEIINFISY